MEDDVSRDVWCCNSHDVTNVLQNDKTVWKILPEKTRLQVKLDNNVLFWSVLDVLAIDRNHGEWHSAVADVGVEDPLQV